MAITNGYATLAELKTRLQDGTYTVDDDDALETIIEAASRWIDKTTGTRFYTVEETRYYTAEAPNRVRIDDLNSLTTLKTDDDNDGTYEITWSSGDYILTPTNASVNGEPYRSLFVPSYSTRVFYSWKDSVAVTGAFGYASSAPAPVKEACLLLSQRLWMRKDAVFGVVGGANLGTVSVVTARIQQDRDVMALLEHVTPRRVHRGLY